MTLDITWPKQRLDKQMLGKYNAINKFEENKMIIQVANYVANDRCNIVRGKTMQFDLDP